MLEHKRVLITTGPTWVPIDDVRVMSNTATGETGIFLAEEARRRRAVVTLLVGPSLRGFKLSGVVVKEFRFFDDLERSLRLQLRKTRYDIVIQAAAVSDFRPARMNKGKIHSGQKRLRLDLVPTPKLIDTIKRLQPDTVLVGFKFEPKTHKNLLFKEAQDLICRSRADCVLANTRFGNRYLAYLVTKNGLISKPVVSKKMAAKKIIRFCERCLEQ